MKRFALLTCAALGLVLHATSAHAGWTLFGKLKCQNCEERRLNKFWKDYYRAVDNFYCSMKKLDWVAYYKNHGYQINCDCPPGCPPHINYAPVVVAPPSFTWAGAANGCLMAGPGCAPKGYGPGPAAGAPAAMPTAPTAGMPGYPAGAMPAYYPAPTGTLPAMAGTPGGY